MDLQDLQIFIRVVQERSFSGAAASLHMAQPSVSQRMKVLEQGLGRPLFARHGRGVTLTEAGEEFLAYVERSLGLLQEGVSAVQARNYRLRISLAAPASLNAYFLPPLLTRLVEMGYDVALEDAHSSVALRKLMDGAIHGAFVLSHTAQAGISHRLLHRDPICCVAAPGHPLTRSTQPAGADLTLADLARHPIALYPFTSTAHTELKALLEERLGAPLRGLLRVSPAEAAKAVLRTASFLTFLPRMAVSRELAEGRLVALPVVDLPQYFWEIRLLHRERKRPDPAATALLDAAASLWTDAETPGP